MVNLVQRGDIEPGKVGLIVIDEAHFSAAASYRTIANYFSSSLLCYFTGSKFRSDSKPLPHVHYSEVEELDELGRSVIRYAPVADYEFSLQNAWKLNPPPIKKLCLQEATSTAFLVEENDREVEYDPETFFAKVQSDRAWFRQILFADEFSLPVLSMSVRILLDKRKHTGQPHAMLVRALNINHVHRVAKLLEEYFPVLQGRVGAIHFEHESYDLAGRPSEIINRFYNGEHWVIVHCGLVSVGFDHKWVSVSCCLCVLKSMSPAEQEWGRALRRVPGPPPGQFPELNHPNWAVVVTHSALALRELFEKFQTGVASDVIRDAPTRKHALPVVTAAYEAGETILKLSNTTAVKPGDVLELQVPVVVGESVSPKFSLIEELHSTGEKSGSADSTASSNASASGTADSARKPSPPAIEDSRQLQLLPWQEEAQAIANKLTEIRSVRTYQVQVEAVLDHQRVQITPAWCDIPEGVEVGKSRALVELPNANFLQHVGLDWQVLVGDELISYSDYRKKVVLQKHGMSLDESGEIVVGGVRLKDTMPPMAYDLFLKGLDHELASLDVEVPYSNAIARPDKAKLEMQARYGAAVRSLINDLFKQRGLIKDGMAGRSLIERPVVLLGEAIARVEEKGHSPDFANNSALLHSAVFGFVKERTVRGWSEHTSEAQYQEAIALACQFLFRLREQLQWRPRR